MRDLKQQQCWLAADWGQTKSQTGHIQQAFLSIYLLWRHHGGHSATWPKLLHVLMALERRGAVVGGRGAHNSRQLFALIVRWDSALLNGADTLLINGKCCIYILASGTIQLLRWQGAQCWLHSVTNPTGCPFGLIVTNPIEKRLIDLLTDCLVEW